MKTCRECKVEKSRTSFCKNKSIKDGLNLYCKSCAEIKRQEWRKKNPEKAKIQARKYCDNHPERILRANKKWRESNKLKIQQYGKMRRRTYPNLYLLKTAKERAKKLGVTFDLQSSDITIPEKCPYLGIPLKMSEGRMSDHSPTLDRIDNNLGYIPKNVIIVSWRANRLKGDSTPKELRKIAAAVERLLY